MTGACKSLAASCDRMGCHGCFGQTALEASPGLSYDDAGDECRGISKRRHSGHEWQNQLAEVRISKRRWFGISSGRCLCICHDPVRQNVGELLGAFLIYA